jgi:hypothetical protein
VAHVLLSSVLVQPSRLAFEIRRSRAIRAVARVRWQPMLLLLAISCVTAEARAESTESPLIVADSSQASNSNSNVSDTPHPLPAPVAPMIRPQTFDRDRWYGWQTLTVDGAALFVLISSVTVFGSDNRNPTGDGVATSLLALSGTTYLLGGPIVHAAHGNWPAAAESLGLRVALPLFVGFLGGSASNCANSSDEDHPSGLCQAVAIGIGATIGIGIAVALDAAVLAREERPAKSAALGLSAIPFVSADRSHAVIGFAGRF